MITHKKASLGALASAALFLCAAQAQAQSFAFDQKFDLGGFNGNVWGTFTAVDANADTIFQQSEMTFQSLQFVGTAPTLGAISLSFAAPDISSSITTEWFAADKTLGDAFNGFFLTGTSTTGTQMVWVSGPANFFAYGNTPGTNSGGDAQNSTFRFGQITLFDVAGAPVASAQSDEYVTTAVPEPSTYLMMLGGVAALALKARRRKA
jgi:hypothetical protein